MVRFAKSLERAHASGGDVHHQFHKPQTAFSGNATATLHAAERVPLFREYYFSATV